MGFIISLITLLVIGGYCVYLRLEEGTAGMFVAPFIVSMLWFLFESVYKYSHKGFRK